MALDDERVFSVKARICRTIKGFRMAPACSKDERRQLESIATSALLSLSGELRGEYYPLTGSTNYAAKPSGTNSAKTISPSRSQTQRCCFRPASGAIGQLLTVCS